MKVIILVPSIKATGPINVVSNIISEAKNNNIDILLVEVRKSQDSNYKEVLQSYIDRPILFLGSSSFFGISKFKQIIAEFNPDVIHSHGFFPDLYNGYLSKNNYLKISTCHNVIHEDYFNAYGKLKGLLFSKIHYFNYRSYFDTIVGCSHTVSDNLVNHSIANNKVFTIFNGINIERFKPISDSEKKMRKSKENLINKNIYIYCGGLDPVKKVPDLIRIFEKTANNNDILFILGDGDDLKRCIDSIKSDNVILKGRVPNPEYYLQMSDYVVSNSTSEGYPLAILEALACGCIAFLSEIPSHVEILRSYPNVSFPLNLLHTVNNIPNTNKIDISQLNHKLMAKQYFCKYFELSKKG